MKIVGICGSLRAGSSNAALLRAAAAIAPPELEVSVYEGLGGLPPFNPDIDHEDDIPPAPVAELRALLANADGLLISSPEYAHGVPGSLKNALDWLVSTGELMGKPAVVIGSGPFARASLTETLTMLSATVLAESPTVGPPLRTQFGTDGSIEDPGLAEALHAVLAELAASLAPAPAG